MSFTGIINNRNHKSLYYTKYIIRDLPNINIYLFAYFPTIRSRIYQNWVVFALKEKCHLISLPSSFHILPQSKKHQGPIIYIIIGPNLPLNCIEKLVEINVQFILFSLKQKWYAFFVLFDIIQNKFHLENIINKTVISNNRRVLPILSFFIK